MVGKKYFLTGITKYISRPEENDIPSRTTTGTSYLPWWWCRKITHTIEGGANAPDQISVQYRDIMGNIIREGRILDGLEQCATAEYNYIGQMIIQRSAQANKEGWPAAYTGKWEYTWDGQIAREYNVYEGYIEYLYKNTASTGKEVWMYDYTATSTGSGIHSTVRYDNLGRTILEQTPLVKQGSVVYYAAQEYYYDRNGVAGLLEKTRQQVNKPGESAAWTEVDKSTLVLRNPL